MERIASAEEQVAETSVGPRTDPRQLLAIFLGGALGALARCALVEAVAIEPGSWPWVTFAVNLLAAALLGALMAHLHTTPPRTVYLRSFLGTGVCGALSTFSTLMVELLGMLERGEVGLALGYGGASVAGGLLAVTLAGARLRRSRRAA